MVGGCRVRGRGRRQVHRGGRERCRRREVDRDGWHRHCPCRIATSPVRRTSSRARPMRAGTLSANITEPAAPGTLGTGGRTALGGEVMATTPIAEADVDGPSVYDGWAQIPSLYSGAGRATPSGAAKWRTVLGDHVMVADVHPSGSAKDPAGRTTRPGAAGARLDSPGNGRMTSSRRRGPPTVWNLDCQKSARFSAAMDGVPCVSRVAPRAW